MAAFTVDRRAGRIRDAFRIRDLLDRQARLRNEIGFLEGQVLVLEDVRVLEGRARAHHVDVGATRGPVAVAPVPVRDPTSH
jgi:hypothetical protein